MVMHEGSSTGKFNGSEIPIEQYLSNKRKRTNVSHCNKSINGNRVLKQVKNTCIYIYRSFWVLRGRSNLYYTLTRVMMLISKRNGSRFYILVRMARIHKELKIIPE